MIVKTLFLKQLLRRWCSSQVIPKATGSPYVYFHPACHSDTHDDIARGLKVQPDFVSEEEEKSLFNEVEPRIKRMKYQFSHWDDAIHGYREIERSQWNEANSVVLKRLMEEAFHKDDLAGMLPQVHILDLSADGFIKPHVDSVRYCGSTIAGISLLSDSIMRFVPHEGDTTQVVDVLLRRRSLYIIRDALRYKYTHEILSSAESFFNGVPVPRSRRMSIIRRCQAAPEDIEDS